MRHLFLLVELLQLTVLLTLISSSAALSSATALAPPYAEVPHCYNLPRSPAELCWGERSRGSVGPLGNCPVTFQLLHCTSMFPLLDRLRRGSPYLEYNSAQRIRARVGRRVRQRSVSEWSFLELPKWNRRVSWHSNSSPCAASSEAPDVYLSPCQAKLAQLQDGKDRSGRYFVAHLSGKPRWMEVGRFYDCNRIKQREGSRIVLLRILRVGEPDGTCKIGQPFLENYRAWATILQHFRGPKVHVAKHRPKKWFKYIRGHRQEKTRLRIDSLERVPSDDQGRFRSAMDDPMLAALMVWLKACSLFDGEGSSENMSELASRGGSKIACGWFVFQAVRRYEKPSLHLPLLRLQALTIADKKELSLLGPDPLAVLDPPLNRLVVDSLVLGRTEMLPILGEDNPPEVSTEQTISSL